MTNVTISEPPARASAHCRHYSFDVRNFLEGGGPRCARGIDLSGSGMPKRCMPKGPSDNFSPCGEREEYSDAERLAWLVWRRDSMRRMIIILAAIPDRTDESSWGKTGELPCPACNSGTVRWTRAAVNGHLWASCSTPHCFGMIQ